MLRHSRQHKMYLRNIAQEAEADMVSLIGITNAQYNRLKPTLEVRPPRKFTKHNLMCQIKTRYKGIVYDIDNIYQIHTKAVIMTISTGVRYAVDHIIPIDSELVSGLEISYNLQIITLTENVVKSNNFIPYTKEYNNTLEYMIDNGINTIEQESYNALKAILP